MKLKLTIALRETQTLDEILSFFTDKDWCFINSLDSVILISVGGGLTYDFALAGQMAETIHLQRVPALRSLLQTMQRPLSRSRLIRLAKGEHNLHENSFHRFQRQLIYIPLQATDSLFITETQTLKLNPGFVHNHQGKFVHKIINLSNTPAIFLQLETLATHSVETAYFLETHQLDVLDSVSMQNLLDILHKDLAQSSLAVEKLSLLVEQLQNFAHNWKQILDRFGNDWRGELSYQDLIFTFSTLMNNKQAYLTTAGKQAVAVIESTLSTANRPKARRHFSRYLFAQRLPLPDSQQCPEFKKPIFIVSAPRTGSTLLFETLAQFPQLWSTGEENHELMEDIAELHPAAQGFVSNRLTAADASKTVVNQLKQHFVRQLQNREAVNYLKQPPEQRPSVIRFLEKTPKNALRIPFLKAAFPDALFIYLYRKPLENISSLLEGWRSQRFVAYRNLPNWPHQQWSFFLPPGWQSLHSASLATIAAYQWQVCNDTILEDLNTLPASDWCWLSYDDLILQPQLTLSRIAHFAELDQDDDINELLQQTLPISRLTLSDPADNKWRKYASELATVLPTLKIPPLFQSLQ